MRGIFRSPHVVVGGFVMAFALRAAAQEVPPKSLASLASSSFQEREKAQAELLEWGRRHSEGGLDNLLDQSRQAEDPEVRIRCLHVLKELIGEEYLKNGEGYIGIAMKDELANIPGDPNARPVIRVTLVQVGTGAQAAGVRVNDLIVSLGDEVWKGEEASKALQEKIRMMKPGRKIQLGILRDNQVFKLEVVLGRRPVAADRPHSNNLDATPEALERAAKEAYFRNWLSQRKAVK